MAANNAAEAAVLAWLVDGFEPPAVAHSASTQDLARALAVIWPEYVRKIRRASESVIDTNMQRVTDPDIRRMHLEREYQFEDLSYTRAISRMSADLRIARVLNDKNLERRIEEIVQREKNYNKLRLRATVRRTARIAEHFEMRSEDVRNDWEGGALWLMDPTKKEHTLDCLAMEGETWAWGVLRWINPANRHAGCGCKLVPDSNAPRITRPPTAPQGFDMGAIQPAKSKSMITDLANDSNTNAWSNLWPF